MSLVKSPLFSLSKVGRYAHHNIQGIYAGKVIYRVKMSNISNMQLKTEFEIVRRLGKALNMGVGLPRIEYSA